jgi:hypothetical protein
VIHKGLRERGVPEYDGLPEISLGIIKFFSNPEKIKKILLFQRNPPLQAGMHENIIFQFEKGA